MSADAPLSPSAPGSDEVELVTLPSSAGVDGGGSQQVPVPTNFKRAILADVLGQDGLLVMSRGLGYRDILTKVLKLYCTAGSLVFVLNANTDAGLLRRLIEAEGAARPLRLWPCVCPA